MVASTSNTMVVGSTTQESVVEKRISLSMKNEIEENRSLVIEEIGCTENIGHKLTLSVEGRDDTATQIFDTDDSFTETREERTCYSSPTAEGRDDMVSFTVALENDDEFEGREIDDCTTVSTLTTGNSIATMTHPGWNSKISSDNSIEVSPIESIASVYTEDTEESIFMNEFLQCYECENFLYGPLEASDIPDDAESPPNSIVFKFFTSKQKQKQKDKDTTKPKRQEELSEECILGVSDVAYVKVLAQIDENGDILGDTASHIRTDDGEAPSDEDFNDKKQTKDTSTLTERQVQPEHFTFSSEDSADLDELMDKDPLFHEDKATDPPTNESGTEDRGKPRVQTIGTDSLRKAKVKKSLSETTLNAFALQGFIPKALLYPFTSPEQDQHEETIEKEKNRDIQDDLDDESMVLEIVRSKSSDNGVPVSIRVSPRKPNRQSVETPRKKQRKSEKEEVTISSADRAEAQTVQDSGIASQRAELTLYEDSIREDVMEAGTVLEGALWHDALENTVERDTVHEKTAREDEGQEGPTDDVKEGSAQDSVVVDGTFEEAPARAETIHNGVVLEDDPTGQTEGPMRESKAEELSNKEEGKAKGSHNAGKEVPTSPRSPLKDASGEVLTDLEYSEDDTIDNERKPVLSFDSASELDKDDNEGDGYTAVTADNTTLTTVQTVPERNPLLSSDSGVISMNKQHVEITTESTRLDKSVDDAVVKVVDRDKAVDHAYNVFTIPSSPSDELGRGGGSVNGDSVNFPEGPSLCDSVSVLDGADGNKPLQANGFFEDSGDACAITSAPSDDALPKSRTSLCRQVEVAAHSMEIEVEVSDDSDKDGIHQLVSDTYRSLEDEVEQLVSTAFDTVGDSGNRGATTEKVATRVGKKRSRKVPHRTEEKESVWFFWLCAEEESTASENDDDDDDEISSRVELKTSSPAHKHLAENRTPEKASTRQIENDDKVVVSVEAALNDEYSNTFQIDQDELARTIQSIEARQQEGFRRGEIFITLSEHEEPEELAAFEKAIAKMKAPRKWPRKTSLVLKTPFSTSTSPLQPTTFQSSTPTDKIVAIELPIAEKPVVFPPRSSLRSSLPRSKEKKDEANDDGSALNSVPSDERSPVLQTLENDGFVFDPSHEWKSLIKDLTFPFVAQGTEAESAEETVRSRPDLTVYQVLSLHRPYHYNYREFSEIARDLFFVDLILPGKPTLRVQSSNRKVSRPVSSMSSSVSSSSVSQDVEQEEREKVDRLEELERLMETSSQTRSKRKPFATNIVRPKLATTFAHYNPGNSRVTPL